MRLLLASGCFPSVTPPPSLSGEQVVCGPGFRDRVLGEQILSLRAPEGSFDLLELAKRLSPEQSPEVLVCSVDAELRSTPRNLGAFSGPKVLLVTEAHSAPSALSRIIAYARSEPFDRVILVSNRHHASFFRAAGIEPFWFPGLTFSHSDTVVANARKTQREIRIAFSRASERLSPRLERASGAVRRSGTRLDTSWSAETNPLAEFGRSLVSLNFSENGELNTRNFEILAAGSALLTERGAGDSGFDELWSDRQAVMFSSEAELVERAQYLVKHPDEAAAIGAVGKEWFETHLNLERRRRDFCGIALEGRPVPEFRLPPKTPSRIQFTGRNVAAFDALQELHGNKDRVTVCVSECSRPVVGEILEVLPRIRITEGNTPDLAADVTVVTAQDTAIQIPPRTVAVWAADLDGERLEALTDQCRQVGLAKTKEDIAWFGRPAVRTHDSVAAAYACLDVGNYSAALDHARRALQDNARSLVALLLMGELARQADNLPLVTKLMGTATSIDPYYYGIEEFVRDAATPSRRSATRLVVSANAQLERGHFRNALMRALAATAVDPTSATANYLAGICHVELGDFDAALYGLQRAAELGPGNPEPYLEAGMAARQLGRLPEAVGAFVEAAALDDSPSVQAALAEVANAYGVPHVAAYCRSTPLSQKGSKLDCDSQREPCDLVIAHLELTSKHGTGVYMQRLFPDQRQVVTIRSTSRYGGEQEFGGTHFVFNGAGLTCEQRKRQLRAFLHRYEVRRILVVPYYEVDFVNATLVHEITGAPLCIYAMDDQVVYADKVDKELARRAFERADLRLVISAKMRDAYEEAFRLPFELLPPVLDDSTAIPNHWDSRRDPLRAIMVGNVWSRQQFVQTYAAVSACGLKVDWYGHGAKAPWLPKDLTVFEKDGIYCRGFAEEGELLRQIAQHTFLIVPSGMLDGTDQESEWLTRLSLPSKMVYTLVKSQIPMLVLGSPETAAGEFVTRLGVGMCCGYDAAQIKAAIRSFTVPESRKQFVARAKAVAPTFAIKGGAEWIWSQLERKDTEDNPFNALFPRAAAMCAD